MLPYMPFLLLFAALSASAAPVDAEPAALTPSNGPSNAGPADAALADIATADAATADFSACSSWYNWYGNGRWTYVDVQFCFEQTKSSTIAAVTQKNGQYYWGGAWYSANKYGMSWTIQGTVVGVEDFQGLGTTTGGTGRTEYYTFSHKISPGTYTVTLTYDQTGPYWGDDAAIHEPASFTIVVGSY
jgi:hypothetical protein